MRVENILMSSAVPHSGYPDGTSLLIGPSVNDVAHSTELFGPMTKHIGT
jgi:hypothetical protein